MTNTQELRIRAFNDWPAETPFPIEQKYLALLARHNIAQPLVSCHLAGADDPDFHKRVAYLLDGLDALPKRPDWAFEAFYIPLELEMTLVKGNSGRSRFFEYKALLGTLETSLVSSLADFAKLVPLQLCEFAAARILTAKNRNDNNDKMMLNRATEAFGNSLFDGFCDKYLAGSVSTDIAVRAGNQRKAGGLIRLLLRGAPIELDGVTYSTDDVDRLGILSSAVLPSIRNDRFHGSAFPSFRSSAYKIKDYAGFQFASTATFLLVLASIAHRWPASLSTSDLADTVAANTALFGKVFEEQLRK